MAVSNVFGLVARFFPLALGLVAEGFDLSFAMWLLLLGPLGWLLGLPTNDHSQRGKAVY